MYDFLKEVQNDDRTNPVNLEPIDLNLNKLSQYEFSNEDNFERYMVDEVQQKQHPQQHISSFLLQNEMENFWNANFEIDDESFFKDFL